MNNAIFYNANKSFFHKPNKTPTCAQFRSPYKYYNAFDVETAIDDDAWIYGAAATTALRRPQLNVHNSGILMVWNCTFLCLQRGITENDDLRRFIHTHLNVRLHETILCQIIFGNGRLIASSYDGFV